MADNSSPAMVCRFYSMGSCRFGDKCRYEHINPPAPAAAAPPSTNNNTPNNHHEEKCRFDGEDESHTAPSKLPILCKFFNSPSGCRYGDNCFYTHEYFGSVPLECQGRQAQATEGHEDDEKDFVCGVCMESVNAMQRRFGIMQNCEHVFCFDCICLWRRGKEENNRRCPLCREKSDWVLPAFSHQSGEQKKKWLEQEMKRMSAVPCKDFDRKKLLSYCPFGPDCFYGHFDKEGRDIKGFELVDENRLRYAMKKRGAQRRGGRRLYQSQVEVTERVLREIEAIVGQHLQALDNYAQAFGLNENSEEEDDLPDLLYENAGSSDDDLPELLYE